MRRYIDADRIDWQLIIPTNPTTAEENMIYRARKLVESQPKADVVEVVRCKDCKFRKIEFVWNGKRYKMCANTDYPTDDDAYCSYGERKAYEI